MKTIKRIIMVTLIIVLFCCGLAYYFKDDIYIFYREEILKVRDDVTIKKNSYYNDNDYEFVQNTNDFIAKDKNHLKNIFYTIINSGVSSFTFYCDDNYKNCENDTVLISGNDEILSNINNFVHPFNSFNKISTSYNDYGEVTLTIYKTYSNDEIAYINNEVDSIINDKITKNMTRKDKIRIIHDYIIDNSKYATDKIREDNPDASFNKANYILENKYGTCSAYSDLMSIFLYKFNINNIKVSSESHIWNLVYYNKDWYHLDLTWDDPVMSDGSDRLDTLFFLITSSRLKELNVGEHNFNSDVFKEAK